MKIKELFKAGKQGKNFYIYAETAFIHHGKKRHLMRLVDAAVKGRCDGIKFQLLLDMDNAYCKDTGAYKKIGNFRLSGDSWLEVMGYAKKQGLEVIVLPIDLKAAGFCTENAGCVDSIEIHSICFNDFFLLKELSKLADMPLILGTGGRSLKEIDYALKCLRPADKVILMHGIQSFPTKAEDANLSKIKRLKELYKLPAGYADHTKFNDSTGDRLTEYSYLLGARIFEKHITLKKGEKRTDYESAVSYRDILKLRENLGRLVTVINEGTGFSLNKAEIEYRNRKKELVYAKDIKAGERIDYDSLGFKVCSKKSDFEQLDIGKVVNHRASKGLKKNEAVKAQDIGEGA
jgi:sialic acid synthase SpsE